MDFEGRRHEAKPWNPRPEAEGGTTRATRQGVLAAGVGLQKKKRKANDRKGKKEKQEHACKRKLRKESRGKERKGRKGMQRKERKERKGMQESGKERMQMNAKERR